MSHHKTPPHRGRGLIWGTVILWWQYHFPKHGEVWASARRKDHPGMQLLYSLAFWAAVAMLLLIFILNATSHR